MKYLLKLIADSCQLEAERTQKEAEGHAFCLEINLRRCQIPPVTSFVPAAAAADRRRIAKHPAKVLTL